MNDTSCSSQKTCLACNTMSGCHWCGFGIDTEQACKSKFEGCWWGASCDSCFRNQPEFVGYGSGWPYVFMALGGILVLVFLFVVSNVMLSVFSGNKRIQDYDPVNSSFVEMSNINDDPDISLEDSFLAENPIAEPEPMNDSAWKFVRRNPFRKLKLVSIVRVILIVVIVTLGITVVIVASVSPYEPGFSVCNKYMEWSSLFDNISKIAKDGVRFRGRFNLVVSFMNPNKFDMSLDTCLGQFYYEKSYIGYFTYDRNFYNSSFVVPAGSVHDVLIVTELDVSVGDAMRLAEDYIKNKVKLSILTQATVGLIASKDVRYTHHFKMPEVLMDMSQTDDTYCKCKLKK